MTTVSRFGPRRGPASSMVDVNTRVLCVDDEADVRALLERQLEGRYNCYFAASGAEALKRLQSEGPFAVVVSDYSMPSMDGVTLLREIHQRYPDTILIMMTAHADVTIAVSALHEGAIFRFLRKPWDPNLLTRYIDDAIEQYRLRESDRKMTAAMKRLNRKLDEKVRRLEVANDLLKRWIEFSPAVLYSSLRTESGLTPTYISANIAGLVGYDAETVLSDEGFWVSHIHPQDRARVLGEIDRADGSGRKTQVIEYRFKHQDGEYRWLQDTFRKRAGKSGEPAELTGSWIDISDRKRAETLAVITEKTIPQLQ